jgi:hypothetical protein
MKRFILDTSIFTNPDVFSQFAPDYEAAIRAFVALARRTGREFYIPGSVYTELGQVKDLTAVAADFESIVFVRSPRKYDLSIPSELLYELIEEVRERINRGLRVAEEAAKEAVLSEEDVGRRITRLRGRYREVLRQGILDSKEDVDVLLLAYELDGVLVSADEGMRKWADKVGIKVCNPRHIRQILENLIEAGRGPGQS